MIFGIVAKEGGEALCFEHEAGVVGVGCHSADCIFGAGEVEVFFGFDCEFDVFVHVVGVVAVAVAAAGALSSCVVCHGVDVVTTGDFIVIFAGIVSMRRSESSKVIVIYFACIGLSLFFYTRNKIKIK